MSGGYCTALAFIEQINFSICHLSRIQVISVFQKSPPWRAYLKASVFSVRKRRLRVNVIRIRRKKVFVIENTQLHVDGVSIPSKNQCS